ncbi:MAG: TM2 domain-containing protein [Lachnospiraceae bacterium]|nr:TM2 domain-containing protein [Lachnospiraceae bacterium]
MKKTDLKHKVLRSLYNYFLFFLLVAFLVTCSTMLFVSILSETLNIELTGDNLNVAAKLTFLNVIFLSILFTVIDAFRRKFTTERITKRIAEAAKKVIKQGYPEKVVYVTHTPKDVKRPILIIFAIMLGIFGVHCFYVGRNKKGIVMLCLGVLSVFMGILSINNMITSGITYLLSMVVGVNTLMWMIDAFDACIFKFKIPVYIDPEVKDENSRGGN